MGPIDQLLKANEAYAASFTNGDLPVAPAKKTAIVVCMDARIDPARVLGLEAGDAHVIRNAGGRMAEAIRSLVISQQLLGTKEVAVIHHTDCGMLTVTDEDIRQRLRKTLGADADHVAFLPFKDLDQSVRDDMQFYRASPLVRHDATVRGFVYDVGNGRLREVT